jgi:hypothetical protein
VFITGTDTGVGKTALAAALMAAGPVHLVYWKPVQTGASRDDDDTTEVRRLVGLSRERWIEPGYRFAAPASLHHAAEVEGGEVSIEILRAVARGQDPRILISWSSTRTSAPRNSRASHAPAWMWSVSDGMRKRLSPSASEANRISWSARWRSTVAPVPRSASSCLAT